ncbi:MAG: acetyl-CoA hydrolase, partial [Gammaproteobacteria bacterium]
MNPEARAGTLLDSVEDCADRIIEMLDGEIICGAPLGLGKPNPLINAIYRRACRDQAIQLRIMTALSLERPTPDSELERRFLEPFVARHFGNYPELEYVADVRAGTVPGNVRISEFYFKSGSFLHVSDAQRNYVSSNYTHVARDMLDHGANLIVQMVARRTVDGVDRYSLSCNSDVTLDLVPLLREREAQGGAPFLMAGMVNNNLPFMYRDAMVEREFFDLIVENEQYHHRLFGVPNMPISDTDHMIGLRASALVRDGGTVQVGIGSLGDAFAYSTRLRHRNNDAWRATLDAAGADLATGGLISREGGLTPFRQGLYAGSEMFSGGLLELYGAGILSRRVYDHEGLQALVNEGLVEDAVKPELLGHLQDRGIVASPLAEADVELLRHFG